MVLTAFNLAPFCEVSSDNFFDIICNVYPANIDRPILPHETSNTAHVIPEVRELVASKAVHVGLEHIVRRRQPVEIAAVLSVWAYTTSEKKTEVAAYY